MALYPNVADPGNWQSFLIREDIKNLSPAEQKKKYLIEQLQFEDFVAQQKYLQSMSLNSLTNQLHQGGDVANSISSVDFVGVFTTVTESTTFVDVTFKDEVNVVGAGVPFITVNNNQVGGGTVASFPYDYVSGAQSKILRFSHTHTANAGGVAAARLLNVASLESSITSTTLSGAAGGAQTGVTFTYAQGEGISGGGANISCDVIVSGGGDTLDEITIDGTIPSGLYYPGNTFTATAAAIGAGGTGEVIVTIQSSDLYGDVLSLAGTSIDENGAEIYSSANNPGRQLSLAYTSTDTIVAVPTI